MEDEQFADAPQDVDEISRIDTLYTYHRSIPIQANLLEYDSESSTEEESCEDEDGFLEKDLDRVYGQDWEDVSGGISSNTLLLRTTD